MPEANETVLYGFWSQAYRGKEPKLLAYGWGSDLISEAERAFQAAFPKRSITNITITRNYTEEQYQQIAASQRKLTKAELEALWQEELAELEESL